MTASLRWLLLGGLSAALAVGCATTDPSGDIDASAGQVADRTGLVVRWRPVGDRDAPAEGVWDGRGELTAPQAVTMALAGNPAIRADLAAIAAARGDFAQAHLPANPVANVMAGWNVDAAASMITAGVMQSLSSLWLLPARKDAAAARLQQAVLQTADNAIDLAASVEQSHRRIVFYQQLLPVLAERRRLLLLARKAADAKRRAGLGSSLDVNRVRTALLETEADQRTARGDLAIEKRKLLEMIDRADAPAQWSAAAEAEDANSAPDESALVTLASKHRLDLLAASWSVRARAARLREAELEAYPDVGLGVGAEREVPANGKTMNKVGPSVRVELPIFDQGQAQIAKAAAELDQARMAARAADQRATLEVRRAREALQTAARQCEAYRAEIIPLAERNADDAQSAFEAGDVDLLYLLTAQRDVTRARATLLTHEMQRDLARMDLARAVGGKRILDTMDKP
jgi:cobalt-zinc-cadmium efflux system outer membrane protein